ncbi:polysaccharide biosynthesis tyrosine autokinase [Malikia spinosa]|uniref:polysaccharide biosynthesis tyrosine autokinase n=1 Tax=Malikia spinosa TaxID=86180 RepID=UPI002FD911FC
MNFPPSLNPPANLPPVTQQQQEEDDSISLLDLLDVVIEQRWLIGAVTAAAIAIGGSYALTATPIYEANTLIQVEDSKGSSLGGLIGDAGNLFDIKSPATAEIEILRSRLVVGQAVSNLQLDLNVTPKYLPVLGRWLSRRATEPSSPGFLGMDGYVSGNEALQVARFEVPKALEGQRFSVKLTANGYALHSADGQALGQAAFGAPLGFSLMGNQGELLVASAVGQPGAEFYVSKRSHLAVTEGLQADLKIAEQGKQSGVLRSSLQGAEPEQISRILNEVGTLYVRQNVERKAAEAEKSIAFLNSQLPDLRKELEASEGKFNQFRSQQGTFDLDSEAKAMLGQGVELKVKLLEAQQKRKELETRFTAQHPSVQALDNQIQALQREIGGLDGKAKSFPSTQQDLLRLTRDVKVNSELYTNLLNSFQQLRLVKEGKVGNVRIVDTAVAPEKPVKPQRGLVLALSGVLGLLVGLGLAFLRNSLKPGIKSADELEQALGLHVFATVPKSAVQQQLAVQIVAKKPGVHLLAAVKPDEPAIESLRSLRTALQFAMLDARNNIVLITGPTPGIGKSFTSANFAAVLAAAGKRVLLIDGDMRKGHIHQFFGMERGMGLSEVIAGSQTLAQTLHRQLLPGLDFLSTGTTPPNPAELLMAPSVQQLLQGASQQYDIVIIDTPPVLAVADTAVLAPQAGTVFLIARSEITALGEVQESLKRLTQAGVAVKGAIFNGLDLSKRRYGHGYGYGYKRYGYRYQAYQYGPAETK